MLRTFFLSVLVCTFATSRSYAKIWRVNNNTGIAADFTTIQAAHDKADNTDTLYVEGSSKSYGSLDCKKKLLVIGPGYFLAENPNTQEVLQTAKISLLTVYSESLGSVFMGLEFTSSVNIYANNITIRRNTFLSGSEYDERLLTISYQSENVSFAVKDVIISQNYGLSLRIPYASTGILITNNYFSNSPVHGDVSGVSAFTINNSSAEVVVRNNIFRRGPVIINSKTVFTNNIIYAGSFVNGGSRLVTNNIGNSTQFGIANGNKSGVDMSTVFVGMVNGVYTDVQWKLKAGSPASGAGFGSTPQNPIDDGIYSGEAPYVISGLPPIPSIYFFEVTPIGSNVIPIKVDVKVKSGS